MVGASLRQWTATSISPASRADSISSEKTPSASSAARFTDRSPPPASVKGGRRMVGPAAERADKTEAVCMRDIFEARAPTRRVTSFSFSDKVSESAWFWCKYDCESTGLLSRGVDLNGRRGAHRLQG